jgi:hypothetical protein
MDWSAGVHPLVERIGILDALVIEQFQAKPAAVADARGHPIRLIAVRRPVND